MLKYEKRNNSIIYSKEDSESSDTETTNFQSDNNQFNLVFGDGDGDGGGDGGRNNNNNTITISLPNIYIIPQIIIKKNTANTELIDTINNNNWLIQKNPFTNAFMIFKKIPITNQQTDLLQFHDSWTLYHVVQYCKKQNATAYFVYDDSILMDNFWQQKIIHQNKSSLNDNSQQVTLNILCTANELEKSFYLALAITSNTGTLETITHKLAEMIITPLRLPAILPDSTPDTIQTILRNFLNQKLIKREHLRQINEVLTQDPDPQQYGLDKKLQWKNYTPPMKNNLLWAKLIAIKNKITTTTSWLWHRFSYLKSLWQNFYSLWQNFYR